MSRGLLLDARTIPLAKQRRLHKAKRESATALVPTCGLESTLIASGVIVGAAVPELVAAREAVDDFDVDEAAYRFLSQLPSATCPGFATFDFQFDVYLVMELNRALGGEPVLRTSIARDGGAKIAFVVRGKSLATHIYAETLAMLRWVQAQLVKHSCDARALYFLPCREAWATLIITEAQCRQLREGNVPIEREPPLR